MNFIFAILSVAYIAGIFILAGSPLTRNLTFLNPYSILHIPLYGILTFLLIFSFMPLKLTPSNSSNPSNRKILFLLSGIIALTVAIADEIQQAYVPGRDASISDVLLDVVGIGLALVLVLCFLKTKTANL